MRPIVLICSAAVLIAQSSVASAQTPAKLTESVVRLGKAFEVFSRITYGTQDGWLPTLDVYPPRNQTLPTPVVVFFHAERLRNEQQTACHIAVPGRGHRSP